MIPHTVAGALSIRASSVRLRVGQSECDVNVEITGQDARPRRFYVSHDLLTSLHLHSDDSLALWWDKKNLCLRLGPVLGVMGARQRNSRGAFGQNVEIIRDFVRVARRRGMLAYAFRPQDIDWETNSVRGWVWTSQALRRIKCPLPDVVYDRVASRRSETSATMIAAKEKLLSNPKLQYYNRVFLNKWDVHMMLSKYPGLNKHLPTTQELNSPEVLETFLKRYGVVFVKPTDGSLGAGILRIVRAGKGFSYRYTRLDHPDHHGKASSLRRMIAVTEKLLRNRQYIAQRGLKIAHLNGGPFDVRVLLQKNNNNRWIVHSMVARVAQPGNVVSNLADGGQIVNPRRAIAAVFGASIKPSLMTLRMRRIAKAAAYAIEKEMGFDFAEMGIDLAVDTSAHLWIIEANSRPGRQTNDEGPKRIPRSVVRLVRFLRSRGLQ